MAHVSLYHPLATHCRLTLACQQLLARCPASVYGKTTTTVCSLCFAVQALGPRGNPLYKCYHPLRSEPAHCLYLCKYSKSLKRCLRMQLLCVHCLQLTAKSQTWLQERSACYSFHALRGPYKRSNTFARYISKCLRILRSLNIIHLNNLR